jgi:hypothetical protein
MVLDTSGIGVEVDVVVFIDGTITVCFVSTIGCDVLANTNNKYKLNIVKHTNIPAFRYLFTSTEGV